jgi:hypothetical protein
MTFTHDNKYRMRRKDVTISDEHDNKNEESQMQQENDFT